MTVVEIIDIYNTFSPNYAPMIIARIFYVYPLLIFILFLYVIYHIFIMILIDKSAPENLTMRPMLLIRRPL